jgi:hypothetical protein
MVQRVAIAGFGAIKQSRALPGGWAPVSTMTAPGAELPVLEGPRSGKCCLPLGTLPGAVGISVAGKRLPEIFPARSCFKAWAALGLESRSASLFLGQADSR